MLLLILPVMIYYKQHPWRDIPKGKYKYVCILTVFALSNFFTFMYTTRLLPLLILSLVGNLAPFWTSVLGYFVNGDRVLYVEFGAMVFCFLCIVGMALTKSAENAPEAFTGYTYDQMGLGVCLAVLVTWFRAG
jgi:drug/metabolite transporter (DMT)-like permease